ncbi:DEAD/DEAH box helicase family protein [Paenibacillus sp. GSMTC-2017]|nr:DEAD/DEAH box helicase family protein [Paenibacillus sp. GSMTC-2017]
MRRTRCAACGRMCAYCEACLTMGRSRECELLIRGLYNNPLSSNKMSSGSGLIETPYSINERLGKWGLSPAQHSAAAEALRFVEGTQLLSGVMERVKTKGISRHVSKELCQVPADVHQYVQREVSKHVRKLMRTCKKRQNVLWHKEYFDKGTFISQMKNRALHVITSGGKELWHGATKLFGDIFSRYRSKEGQFDRRSDIQNFLLWAVTGAGKTEMIFPLIDAVISRGGHVLIASPRRDVVIELDPRIRRAFSEATVVTLYGGSEQRWERGHITLSTTHQLFRFHEAFDLVIIDEIDAYPYHGDPMLHYAADKSCKRGAPRLLLSATPPRILQLAAKRGELAHARVPVRFHRHPLPVPKIVQTMSVKQMLDNNKLPIGLVQALRKSLGRGAQLFVFVQRIALVDHLAALIRIRLQCAAVAATSSKDPERAQKVSDFRASKIRILVTTTILERGVTIPKSDVFILDADGGLFDEASLVQMAGRAGRSASDPHGHVYFCAKERSQSQMRAIHHIRAMNRIARKQGYLSDASRNEVSS